jgi:deferrochelatase/peroxidase EfeB
MKASLSVRVYSEAISFAAFDLTAKSRDEIIVMLRGWTDAAERLTGGETARRMGEDLSVEGGEGGPAIGLTHARLIMIMIRGRL